MKKMKKVTKYEKNILVALSTISQLFLLAYQNYTFRTNKLDTLLELNNKLVLDVLNFEIQ